MKKAGIIYIIMMLFICICMTDSGAEHEKLIDNAAVIDNINKSRSANPSTEALYLDLESSLGIAITNNYDLKAINARKKIYDLTITERLRDFFPSLSFSYGNNQTVVLRGTDTRTQAFSIDTEIPIYDGGTRKLAYDIGKLKAILARNDYRLAVNQIVAEVLAAYLDIMQYKGTIEIDRKTLERGMLQLGFIKKEMELGEATRLQVMEIEARVKEVELELEKAINNYNISVNKYKLLLKLDYRQPVYLVGELENDFILKPFSGPLTVDDYIALATRNRKEVESSEIEASVNKKSYRMNELYYFPRFSVGFNYSLSDNQALPQQFIPREKGWGISLKVTSALFGNTLSANAGYQNNANGNSRNVVGNGKIGILDSMAYKRAIVESKIEYLTALEKAKETKQQVAVEVLTSIIALDNTWKMINIARKQLELYDKSLEIEQIKANMGETTRYDLMEKEIYRWKAALSYLDSRIQYMKAGSSLELALGVDIGYLKLSEHRKK